MAISSASTAGMLTINIMADGFNAHVNSSDILLLSILLVMHSPSLFVFKVAIRL